MTFENQKSKVMSTFNSFSGHGVEKIFSSPRGTGLAPKGISVRNWTKVGRKTLYIRGDPLSLSAIELLSSLSLVSNSKKVTDTFYIRRYTARNLVINSTFSVI